MTRQSAYASIEVMKKRSTTPVSASFKARGSLLAIAILMVAAAPIAFLTAPTEARDYDAEIRAVQNQIDQYNAEASRLSAEADTYQNKVSQLNAERLALQAELDKTQAEYDKLVEKIQENEKKLANNQRALGKTMADMYVDNDISPLEMLASSNDIAEYIDKQTQRSSVRDSLSSKITEIKRLKEELEQQKKQAQSLIEDQTNRRNVIAANQAEQQNLLNATKGQEAAYQQLSAEGQAKRRELERQQQIEIARRYAGASGSAVAGDPGKGGYPYNLANSDYYNPVVDPWGMYSRQCVSYTAWKVYQKNGYMPYWGGYGNANQWPGNADRAGIARGSTPRAGSVGVMLTGQYGHVVWVESVNSDGTINISQYNELNAGGPGWGHYSERYNVNPRTYDTYIYF